MKRGRAVAFLLLLCLVAGILVACGDAPESEEPEVASDFVVETDFEYYYEDGAYLADIKMPKVAESVPGGAAINEDLARYNSLEQLKEAEEWLDPLREYSIKRYYSVSEQDGICSLNLFLEQYAADTATGKYDFDAGMVLQDVSSWYYDANEMTILSEEAYLEKLGLTQKGILDEFNKNYGDRYSDRTYDLSHLQFWIDREHRLQFCTAIIDAMDYNAADFDLQIDGTPYPMASEELFPGGGKLLDSKKEYSNEIWAGSWWITESYENAEVLYSYDEETEKTAVCRVRVTGSVDTAEGLPDISTFRGARLGDSRSAILKLYPEINEEKQSELHGSDDELWVGGEGGYLNLCFLFTEDTVTEIVTSIMID